MDTETCSNNRKDLEDVEIFTCTIYSIHDVDDVSRETMDEGFAISKEVTIWRTLWSEY